MSPMIPEFRTAAKDGRRALAAILTTSLLVATPGGGFYEAFGQTVRGEARASSVVAPAIVPSALAVPSAVSPSGSVSLQAAAGLSLATPASYIKEGAASPSIRNNAFNALPAVAKPPVFGSIKALPAAKGFAASLSVVQRSMDGPAPALAARAGEAFDLSKKVSDVEISEAGLAGLGVSRPLTSALFPKGRGETRALSARPIHQGSRSAARLAKTGLEWFGLAGLAAAQVAADPAGLFLVALASLSAATLWELSGEPARLWSALRKAAGRAVTPPAQDRSPLASWLPKVGAAAAVLLALDWGSKFLAHRSLSTFAYHILPQRVPFLTVGVPLAAVLIVYARWALGYAERLAETNPALRKPLRLYDLAVAMALAGILGNGVEALAFHQVGDFIPFGHATANLADFMLVFSMSYRTMAGDFFAAARASQASKEPITLPFWRYFLVPQLAVFGFYLAFGRADVVPSLALYALVYGLLAGFGLLAAAILVTAHLRDFNRAFKPASAPPAPIFDEAALFEHLKRFPPQILMTDFDDTFEENRDGIGTELSDDGISLQTALEAAGIRVIFNTNRPWDMVGKKGEKIGVRQLIGDRLKPEQRKNLIIAVKGGTVYRYGPNGEDPTAPLYEEPALTPEQKARVKELAAPILADMGLVPGADKDVRVGDDQKHEIVFVVEKQRPKADELWRRLSAALAADGLGYGVHIKWPDNPANAPYIKISSVDKAAATRGIMDVLAKEGRSVEPSRVLVTGDDFDDPGFDAPMAEPLPGAIVVSFGQKVKPGQPVYLLPGGPRRLRGLLRPLADHVSAARKATRPKSEGPVSLRLPTMNIAHAEAMA